MCDITIDFFRTGNASGYKTRELWVKKNLPDVYNKIINYCSLLNFQCISFQEMIWVYFNKLTERPKCVTCGKDTKFKNRFDTPYGDFCSNHCLNSNKGEMLRRITQTNQAKHNVDFIPQKKDFISKVKKTKKERYGDENYNNMKQIKQTKFERYNDCGYNNIRKAIETNLIRYEETNPAKSDIVKNKTAVTCYARFGTKSPTESTTVKDKLKNTILLKIKSRFKENEFISYDFSASEYILKCQNCGTIYTIQSALLNERKRNNQETCLICNPIGVPLMSKYEKELKKLIREFYKGKIISGDRKVIGKELDLYLPKNKLSIEFNGLYWHSELYKSNDYHLKKTDLCATKDIELIHLFEDEWIYRKDIVLSIIRNKLGLIKNKIYARNCQIKEISTKDAKVFLDNNHIQGSGNIYSYQIGLYHKEELVSVMTFSKGRLSIGGKSGEWELNRFASRINTVVVGSAEKLFKHFIKEKNPESVITFADRRWFTGSIYLKLGFNFVHKTKPNYWYVINNLRYHRFDFRKSRLIKQGYDGTKTERQIMQERKINRIYDCGNLKFEWKPKNVIS